ncbi:hypothetical protein [Brevibacillus laterosporus]|uniref:hypothetical protein n=1 Tax=Brevibacillus laterosporus TaxID=1465 RepID=UPI00264D4E61|nr:hypothetical protein [Brevibacillus laterosporus]MDN9012161.1 hypothetical protein [Brevibacillus laterosporus]MDO0943257.1 hypothetical protein [Brevibacillus laterosporus]
MKKLLVSLSTFAIFTGALAVPTFAATEINAEKETNFSKVSQQLNPIFKVTKGERVPLYNKIEGVYYTTNDEENFYPYKSGGNWYLLVSNNPPKHGKLFENYPDGRKRTFVIEVTNY